MHKHIFIGEIGKKKLVLLEESFTLVCDWGWSLNRKLFPRGGNGCKTEKESQEEGDEA